MDKTINWLVAFKQEDHGAGPPYDPVWRESYLYGSLPPVNGKRFYIGTDCARTWLTDEQAMNWLFDQAARGLKLVTDPACCAINNQEYEYDRRCEHSGEDESLVGSSALRRGEAEHLAGPARCHSEGLVALGLKLKPSSGA